MREGRDPRERRKWRSQDDEAQGEEVDEAAARDNREWLEIPSEDTSDTIGGP